MEMSIREEGSFLIDEEKRRKAVSKQYDIYGIGNAIVDIQAKAGDELLQKLGRTKGGMHLVTIDEQISILEALSHSDFSRSSGGSAANSIIIVAQLGGRAAYGCRVADDSNGRFYIKEMMELGVDVNAKFASNSVTGTSAILITPDSERTMYTHLGATADFCEDDVDEIKIANSKWLYLEGYLLSSVAGPAAVNKAIRCAKSNGTKIAISCSDIFITELFRDFLDPILDQADLVFANEMEAIKLTDSEHYEQAFARLKHRVPQVILTLGAQGALYYCDGYEELIPGRKVDVVDTTGAGDAFAGAFLYGLSAGLNPMHSAKLATILSAQIVSELGARMRCDLKAIPGVKELLVGV